MVSVSIVNHVELQGKAYMGGVADTLMKLRTALKSVLGVAIVGVLFSGYLSYSELIASKCILGGCSYVMGLPACVYGFVMYSIVLVLSVLGLRSK